VNITWDDIAGAIVFWVFASLLMFSSLEIPV
jgi:hypothetical protein